MNTEPSIPPSMNEVEQEPVQQEPVQNARFLSPNINWPYQRCKILAKALVTNENRLDSSQMRNHVALLTWLANWFSLSLEEFKDTSLFQLVGEHPERFSQAAQKKLLESYHCYSRFGRNLRALFHVPHGTYNYSY